MATIVGILNLWPGQLGQMKFSTLDKWNSKKIGTFFFYNYEDNKFHAQLKWAWKKFYN